MALLSQTAVTLALIAAMALQPAVLWAVPAQCSAGASAVDRSVNGGCCQSELPATGNCCCGQLAGETRLLRVAADEAAACCAAEPATPADANPQQPHLRCTCLHPSQPLSESAPRSAVVPLRILTLCCVLGELADGVGSRSPQAASSEPARVWVAPHFSQLAYCVWRL